MKQVATGMLGPVLEVGLTTYFPLLSGFPLYTYLHPGALMPSLKP